VQKLENEKKNQHNYGTFHDMICGHFSIWVSGLLDVDDENYLKLESRYCCPTKARISTEYLGE
jgi:hypothetical protein